MQKKTMWITAAAIGAVLVLGGAGVAVAASDPFDGDDDRAMSTPTATGTDDGSLSDDDSNRGSDDRGSDDGRDDSGSDDNGRDNSGRDDSGRDDSTDDNGGDDNAVPATAAERSAAEAAALDEVGEGTVREFDTGEADDDYAYKVELVMPDGSETEVELAADLSILRVDRN